jgi:hypothetical protein
MLSVRQAIPHTAEASPRLALVSDTASDWRAMRRPVDPRDNALQRRTIKWLATLPASIRPIQTGRLYPRIVNRIGDLWSQCEYTRLHFQSLLIDRREGREGFPSEVKAELEAFQHYYFEHLSKLPALLWNAVPINPPRIPRRVFAPYADTTVIDLRPL